MQTGRFWLIGGALAAATAASGLAALWLVAALTSSGVAPDAEVLATGRALYRTHCASCHGADLEGQPDWRTPLASGRLPAPPHDATGHTWHHPDGVLLRITREGPAAVVGGGYESDMPGFGRILADEEIGAILKFLKSTWSERERRYQAEMTRREQEGPQ